MTPTSSYCVHALGKLAPMQSLHEASQRLRGIFEFFRGHCSRLTSSAVQVQGTQGNPGMARLGSKHTAEAKTKVIASEEVAAGLLRLHIG